LKGVFAVPQNESTKRLQLLIVAGSGSHHVLVPKEIITQPKKIPMRKRGWKVEHHGSNIHVVKIERPRCSLDFEHWILLMADNHVDSTASRLDIERKLLDEAIKRDATICFIGDTLDLMSHKNDPRHTKGGLRRELLSDGYFDKIIDMAADHYAPYASHVVMWGVGNHESNYLKRMEVDPTANLVRAIKCRAETDAIAGGYGGWIKFQIKLGNNCSGYTVKYMHGGGGSAAMTGGTLDSKRVYSWLEGVDSLVYSHLHTSNVVGLQRLYLSDHKGHYEEKSRYCDCIRIGTTKDAWGKTGGAYGFEVERQFGPAPLRQKWIRLRIEWETKRDGTQIRSTPKLVWDVMDAY
jgi:hypothetical protein